MVDNVELSLIILLTGVVIVFSVLVLLICVIKLYSTIVVSIQDGVNNRKNKKAEKVVQTQKKAEVAVSKKQVSKEKPKPANSEKEQPSKQLSKPSDDGSISGEIVAAIAAAVEVIFGEQPVVIKSIKKSSKTSKRRSVWKSAGMAENTRSF